MRAVDTGNVGEAVVGPAASPGPCTDEEDEDAAPGAGENPRVRAVDEEPSSDGVPEISTNDCRHSSAGETCEMSLFLDGFNPSKN